MLAQELQDYVIDEASIRRNAETNVLPESLVFFSNISDDFFYLAKGKQGLSPIKVDLTFRGKKGGKKIDSLYGRGEVNRVVALFFVTIGTAKITRFGPNVCKNRELHSLFLEMGNRKNITWESALARSRNQYSFETCCTLVTSVLANRRSR